MNDIPPTDTVQSETVYDDVFIVAINEDGKERARAILKYFDCADLSDLLKEWHETDPTRRLGIKFRTGNPLQSELTRAREREKEAEDRCGRIKARQDLYREALIDVRQIVENSNSFCRCDHGKICEIIRTALRWDALAGGKP